MTTVPRALLAPIERELGLLRAVVERSLRPVDSIFDLLEQSASAMHRQAEAEMMRTQAELFERTVAAAREPAELAKGLAGIRRRDG